MAPLPAVPVLALLPFSVPLFFLFPLPYEPRFVRLFSKKGGFCAGFPTPITTRFVTFKIIQTAIFPSFAPENSQKVFLFLFNIQQSLFHRACVKLFIFRLSTFFKQTGLTFPQPTKPVFKRPRATFPQFSHPLLLRLPETMLFEDQKRIFIARKEQPHEHCLRQSTSVQCH